MDLSQIAEELNPTTISIRTQFHYLNIMMILIYSKIFSVDFDLYSHMESLYRQFQEKAKGHHNDNENSSAQTTKEFAAWIEAEAASRHKLTSSQVNTILFIQANHT
jgi:hypothetical protein